MSRSPRTVTSRSTLPRRTVIRDINVEILRTLHSTRDLQLLIEEIDYSPLFRWFVGLNLDQEVWDPTTLTKNRDRLGRGSQAVSGAGGGAVASTQLDLGRARHNGS